MRFSMSEFAVALRKLTVVSLVFLFLVMPLHQAFAATPADSVSGSAPAIVPTADSVSANPKAGSENNTPSKDNGVSGTPSDTESVQIPDTKKSSETGR